jgi:hypothetical protein
LLRPTSTVLNFTAITLAGSLPQARVIDIGSMRLASNSLFRHNSRNSHGLREGELHSCMLGGILCTLDGELEHEGPLVTAEVLSRLQSQMIRLGTLGFLPPVCSRPFVCSGAGSGILDYIRQMATWYPFATGHIEINIPTEGPRRLQSAAGGHGTNYPWVGSKR